MTKKELDILHRDYLNHTRTSIEYAISVLEDVKQQCANSFYHKSAKIFEDKIEELKNLLK